VVENLICLWFPEILKLRMVELHCDGIIKIEGKKKLS